MIVFANEIKFSVNEGRKLNLALLSNAMTTICKLHRDSLPERGLAQNDSRESEFYLDVHENSSKKTLYLLDKICNQSGLLQALSLR